MATEWNDRPGEAQTSLGTAQFARVEALQAARSVLVGSTTIGEGAAGARQVAKVEFPHELTGVARFILDGTDVFNTEGPSETDRDAENRRWFDTGWSAHRREVMAVAQQGSDRAAVEWSAAHPSEPYEAKETDRG